MQNRFCHFLRHFRYDVIFVCNPNSNQQLFSIFCGWRLFKWGPLWLHKVCKICPRHKSFIFIAIYSYWNWSPGRGWSLYFYSNMVFRLFTPPLTSIVWRKESFIKILSQKKEYSFRMTWGWVNDDRFFIFGWTVPLKTCEGKSIDLFPQEQRKFAGRAKHLPLHIFICVLPA